MCAVQDDNQFHQSGEIRFVTKACHDVLKEKHFALTWAPETGYCVFYCLCVALGIPTKMHRTLRIGTCAWAIDHEEAIMAVFKAADVCDTDGKLYAKVGVGASAAKKYFFNELFGESGHLRRDDAYVEDYFFHVRLVVVNSELTRSTPALFLKTNINYKCSINVCHLF